MFEEYIFQCKEFHWIWTSYLRDIVRTSQMIKTRQFGQFGFGG